MPTPKDIRLDERRLALVLLVERVALGTKLYQCLAPANAQSS